MGTLEGTKDVGNSDLERKARGLLTCIEGGSLKGVLAALMVGGCMSSPLAQGEYPEPIVLDQDLWEKHFSGQRILFGLSPDGEFTPYLSSDREVDPGGHPIEEIKLRSLAIEIGGSNTKVCWTSGGDKHCDPPPPR